MGKALASKAPNLSVSPPRTHTHRQTDTQTQRQTHRDRQITEDRLRDRQKDKQTQRQTDRQKNLILLNLLGFSEMLYGANVVWGLRCNVLNYSPRAVWENEMHVLSVYVFPTREMRRMAVIWIVIRYCHRCQSRAWGTALANHQPSQSRGQGGGDRATEWEHVVSHLLLVCFLCDQGHNIILPIFQFQICKQTLHCSLCRLQCPASRALPSETVWLYYDEWPQKAHCFLFTASWSTLVCPP